MIDDVLAQFGLLGSRVRHVGERRNVHWFVDNPERRVVLCRYAADRSREDVEYEVRLLDSLDRRGWPVPVSVAPVVESGGSVWCLFRYLPGRPRKPRSVVGSRREQLERGRLLARVHRDLAELDDLGQRPGWRRADEGLWDRVGRPSVDETLRQFEREHPEPGRVLRSYAEAARESLGQLVHDAPDPIVIHGDFTPWNMRFVSGRLAGVLDFDSAHLDLRVAEFALAWRGQHEGVIAGYEEEWRLEPVEHSLIIPVYWAWIIASAIGGIDAGNYTADSVDWAITHLLRTKLDVASTA